MKNLGKKHYIIIGIWFAINLLQAIFTGLHSDESYYWMYSQNLAWGYFDHPPMMALFIYLGHLILPGEIGVRLLFILFSTVTFALILNELNEKKDLFFVALFMFSFPLMHTHIAGFLALPDAPLLFFTILFIIAYRKFLEQPNWKISILLAVIIAAMIYSKYHAFVIIGLTVLSNLKLFKSKYFYGILILTLLLLMPHLYWQFENEFPTFKYHLIERAKPFRLKYVFPYLLGQLAIAGPLTGVLVFWELSRFKIRNLFQRALIYNILGFYILFFILSFKNRIEAHWTAAIIPMLMMVTYPLIVNDPKIKRWFKRLALPIIILLFLFRLYIALDVIPNVGHLKITFYNRKASALEIKKMAEGKKVAFFDNYAAASNYVFYTGDSMVHLSTPGYRFCQYDLWNYEKYGEGATLFAIQSKHLNPPHLQRMVTGEMKGYIIVDKFQSLDPLQIKLNKIINKGNFLAFQVALTNTANHPVYTQHISEPCLALRQNNIELIAESLTSSSEKTKINPGKTALIHLQIKKNKINRKHPVHIYTRSKENIRGNIISVRPKDIP